MRNVTICKRCAFIKRPVNGLFVYGELDKTLGWVYTYMGEKCQQPACKDCPYALEHLMSETT